MGVGGRRRAQAGADDPDDDRRHRDVLVGSPALAQHALAGEQQHQQPHGHRRLHDYQRCQVDGQQLQRPAQHRQARAQQPAAAFDEPPGQREAQVLLAGSLPGVHGLEGDP